MIELVFKGCLTALVTAILLALLLSFLVFIVYVLATVIKIAWHSFKGDDEDNNSQ